jgi:hypothetical protein
VALRRPVTPTRKEKPMFLCRLRVGFVVDHAWFFVLWFLRGLEEITFETVPFSHFAPMLVGNHDFRRVRFFR